jgi:hypothetical protein
MAKVKRKFVWSTQTMSTAPALSESRASSESKGRDRLEALLRHRKLDHTLTAGLTPGDASDPEIARWLVPTGIPALDARLEGGLPRGHLSEVVGPRSSGRLAIVVSALAGATARGEAVALIDTLDMFDPVSASGALRHAQSGPGEGRGALDFERMLWVRGESCSSTRVSLSSEYGTLQKSVDRAVKALNIVLQAGGFGLVVLDLGEVAPQVIKRLPYTTWLRLQRVIEGSETACVLIGSESIARSSRGVTVMLASGARLGALGPTRSDGGSRETEAHYTDARVVRSRAMTTDDYVRVPLSAAAC